MALVTTEIDALISATTAGIGNFLPEMLTELKDNLEYLDDGNDVIDTTELETMIDSAPGTIWNTTNLQELSDNLSALDTLKGGGLIDITELIALITATPGGTWTEACVQELKDNLVALDV